MNTALHDPFGARTTYRVGGDARALVEIESLDALCSLSGDLRSDVDTYVLGRGSNTLVADQGFDGIVIHLGESFREIAIDPESARVVAGGAADLPVVARKSVDAALTGFEWAVGVPGTIGGAVKMNAGGHGADMASSLVSVEVLTFGSQTPRVMDCDELDFAYRSSALTNRDLVISATLQLSPGEKESSLGTLKEIVRWRREHQPGGSNCGSVFTNPPGDSAGRLIEDAGAKGLRLGTAQVSEKHANFIQADEGGSADDVVALMDRVRSMVEAHSGVSLSTEVKMVGFSPHEAGPAT